MNHVTRSAKISNKTRLAIYDSRYTTRDIRTGFTLVETIVSIGLLMLGIIASLTLVTSTINFSKQTENLTIVVNLAREGIEIIHAIRDKDGFLSLPPGDTEWIVDYLSIEAGLTMPATFSGGTTINECANCTLFNTNNTYRKWGSGVITTPFWRLVELKDTGTADEKQIVSTVRWTSQNGSKVHTYTLNTVLTNWK